MINRTIRTILIAIALSCALYSQTCAASAEATSAEQLYETAFKLIVAGNYGDAYEQLDEIITKHPGTIYAQFAVDRKQRLAGQQLDRGTSPRASRQVPVFHLGRRVFNGNRRHQRHGSEPPQLARPSLPSPATDRFHSSVG